MGDHDPDLAVADGFAQDASIDQGSHDAAALTPIAHQDVPRPAVRRRGWAHGDARGATLGGDDRADLKDRSTLGVAKPCDVVGAAAAKP